MNKISELLPYRTIEKKDEISSIETIDSIGTPRRSNAAVMTREQADSVMEICEDLIADARYRPFFFKRLYAVGPTVFVQLADHARKYGKYPDRLFVKLLREQRVQ